MRSDPYQHYLNILNTSEPNPSFAEVRELVRGERTTRKAFFSYYHYAFGVVVLLTLAGLSSYYFAKARSTQFAMTHPIVSPARTIVSNRALSPSSVPVSKYTKACKVIPVTHAHLCSSEEKSIAATTHDNTPSAALPLQEPSLAARTALPISPLTLLEDDALAPPEVTRWGVFISLGTLFGRASMTSTPFDGAAGIYCDLSPHSAFVVELRQTVFPHAALLHSNTLRDTVVNLDGQSFRNSIGGTSVASVQQLERIASLDIGYRYVLLPDERFSPTAEISAGASTSGLLASISTGVQYALSSGASIGLTAREVQFYSRSSAPLGSFGIESSLSYGW